MEVRFGTHFIEKDPKAHRVKSLERGRKTSKWQK